MKLKNSFHPYAIITIFFWSMAYIMTKLTMQYFSASSLGFLRYIIASLALAVIAIITKLPLPKLRDLPLFIAAGAMGFFLYMISFNHGQSIVTAATGSIIMATSPIITALLARIVFKEKLRAYQWTAIAIGFIGVAVLTLKDGEFTLSKGIIYLLVSSLVFSIYNLLQRKLTGNYTAMQVSTYGIFFGTLMLCFFAPGAIREAAAAPPIQLLYVLILGLGSSAIAYVCWAKAFSKAKNTSQVSNYMFINPLLASLFGFLLAAEVPDNSTVIGGCIILLGLFFFNYGDKLIHKK